MKTYIRLEPPFEWVKLDGALVDSFGVVNHINEYPIGEDNAVAVVPGRYVVAHQLNLPAKTRRQFEAAVPYALEEQLSEEVDEYHFVSVNWKADQDTLVYVVSRNKMLEWRDLANENQITFNQLLPDYQLLPAHDVGDFTVDASNEELRIRASNGFGASLDRDLIDFWMADVALDSTLVFNDQDYATKLKSNHPKRDLRYWDFGDRMANWLGQGSASSLDLLNDEFAPRAKGSSTRYLRWAVAAFLIGIAVKFSFDLYRYTSYSIEHAAIEKESKQILNKIFPDASRVPSGKERFYIEQGIKKGQVKAVDLSQFQPLISRISKVFKRNGIVFDSISFADDTLIITCQLKNLSQVDQIDRQINNIKSVNSELISSNVNDGAVTARYKISG